jgi:tetratricopeptide (TPR) repeat protein
LKHWGVLLVGVLACTPREVVRSIDGELYVDRFIGPRAYEAFVRARIAEESGRLGEAIDAYRAAIDSDPDNALAKVHLAELLCQRAASDADALYSSLYDAGERSAAYFLSRARCSVLRDDRVAARDFAFEALIASPRDPDTVTAVGSIWREVGSRDAASSLDREAKLDAIGPLPKPFSSKLPSTTHASRVALADIDRALFEDDLAKARSLAVSARVSPSSLALRAYAFGKDALAHEQANLVNQANPKDADAVVALLATSNSDGAIVALARVDPRTLSPLGALVLSDVLRRRAATLLSTQDMDASDAAVARLKEQLARP